MVTLLAPLYPVLGWILLLVVLLGIFKLFKPFLKGKLGEFAVATHVKLYLKDPQYILLNDLTLPDGAGATTQIDHLLLSPYGIFGLKPKTIRAGFLAVNIRSNGPKKFIKTVINFRIQFIRTINI